MDFIFHSVYDNGSHRKYFSIYRIDDSRYLAECHHFNQSRMCEGDFEIVKEGDEWKPSNDRYLEEAKFIGEEIDRMVHVEH